MSLNASETAEDSEDAEGAENPPGFQKWDLNGAKGVFLLVVVVAVVVEPISSHVRREKSTR